MTERDKLLKLASELPDAEIGHAIEALENIRLRSTPLIPGSQHDEEARQLHDSWQELAPDLEPYDWGGIDPMTIGKPVSYVPGKGAVVQGG